MSRKDLEAYWDARESYLKAKNLTELEVLNSHELLRDFLLFETKLGRRLVAKDPRSVRAITYTANLMVTEVKEVVLEMFPNKYDAPPNVHARIAIGCHRSMCLLVYDALSHLALEAAQCLVPLKPETPS